MKNNFRIYYDGEEFPEENVRALERAMDGFVRSDIPLAVELVFTAEAEIRRLNRELRETDRVTAFRLWTRSRERRSKERRFPAISTRREIFSSVRWRCA